MGQGKNRRRIAATALFLAVFLIFSSILGNFLLAKDAIAGGMDVEWKVPLPNGSQKMLVVSDGSIIVADEKGTIQEIDQNGTIRWSFDSTQSDNLALGASDFLYLIERGKSQDTVDCLCPNGTLSWRLVSDVPVAELRLGQNGEVYLVEQRNNYSCLVCMTGDGFYKWKFAPEGGLGQFAVLSDGTVIARNTISVWISGGIVKLADNITAISDSGAILWEKDILDKTDPTLGYLNGPYLGPNSTIDLYLTYYNGSMNITEFDRYGGPVPVTQRDGFSRYSDLQDNEIYVTDTWQEKSSDGGILVSNQISEWNATSGTLNWRLEQNGSAWVFDSMKGKGIVLQANGKIVFIGPDGKPGWTVANEVGDWTLLSYNGQGLLIADDQGTIVKTGDNGGIAWKYGFDSQVKAGAIGKEGEIIVLTDYYVISIHQPVLSTTMNYFVVLLAIDLFVTLMSAVGIVDKMWPKAKARIE